eukprot:gene10120-10278_t
MKGSPAVSGVISLEKPGQKIVKRDRRESVSAASVTASELWWGFKDTTLEASYQAASFGATGMLDCVCVIYSIVLGLSCYSARPSNSEPGSGSGSFGDGFDVGTLGMPAVASAGVWLFSRAESIIAKASRIKQLLQLMWMISIPAWAYLLLCGPGFIAPPVSLLHIWASNSWSAHLAVVLSVAMRSCFSQVPLAAHCPAVVVELVANVLGSYRLGLRSPQWLVGRFVCGVGVPLTIAALLQQQGFRFVNYMIIFAMLASHDRYMSALN